MQYEELVARVAEAIIATGNNSLELGKALYEARERRSQKRKSIRKG